jgi:predicted choloylglycine hydrolase
MANDKIAIIKPDGQIFENIKANVQSAKIFIYDEKIPLEENDKIYRQIPSGLVETYIVLDRGYHCAFYSIPGHYQAKVKREESISNDKYKSITNNYYLTGQQSKLNINSIDNSVNEINNGFNIEQLEALLEKLKETIPENISIEDKTTIDESIDVIQTEIAKPQPKRSMLKTALNGLSALKSTVEFAAALATLTQFLQPILH